MSSPHDDQVVKKTDVEPMPVLPKISEDGQDPDSSTVAANSTIENEHSASHNPNPNLPLKQCFECQRSKDQNCFTASQWKKTKGTGRCIGCAYLCVLSGCHLVFPLQPFKQNCAAPVNNKRSMPNSLRINGEGLLVQGDAEIVLQEDHCKAWVLFPVL